METAGELTATQAKAVLAEMVETGSRSGDIAAEHGLRGAWTPAPSRRSSTRSSRAHPDEWAQFVDGDDKARGKLTGFFMGKVMQASKGQADGKVATALLRSRAGL